MAEADPGTTCLAADLAGKRSPVTMGQHLTSRFDDSFKCRGAHAAGRDE
jgi:hypothetical protein